MSYDLILQTMFAETDLVERGLANSPNGVLGI